ncbi:branched-chain amino acid ABC transporter substrate-binding protein [Aurantimonas endophytica]|uniref:Branched-chain amino acid transport system substrate-binding protein n=1 Tax=Aurantimonas endophytica TaxID=1522175 RepID=A0A7W6HBC4_9HYPH|nr:branched-chain amino acid ABC transporter substrate-binding protein [Aurantimonas endophytica]MBB4001783.1 branched-chain amino acid transport system substrate-binding protein [Aurantimonas endophytica]MCO6402580.1 ABC transporter substrate-binding protein [Aurantimonas endophytica]
MSDASLPRSKLRLTLFLAAWLVSPAGAQQPVAPVVIGVAAPLSGSEAILGEQLRSGVEAAVARLSGTDGRAETVTADTACSAEGGRQAAETFVATDVAIVVGFLCTEALEAALPVLRTAAIPTLNVGVRANRLTDRRERTGDLIWRIAPRSDAEAAKVAQILASRWRDQPFGLVEDGSITARGLTDSVRRLLEEQGMVPQTIDNYRPAEEKQFALVRRLERTGVTRFVIAGDRPDIATIARDAGELGLELEIVGGESLLDEASIDVPLPDGVVAVAPRMRFPELAGSADAPTPADDTAPKGYFGPAFAATEIAVAAVRAARESSRTVPAVLQSGAFATELGTVRFDAKGDSDLDLYRVFVWRGDRFADEAGG